MTRDLYSTAAETAALLREGQSYRRERLQAADMVTVVEAASLMGVDALTVAAWISGGRCIGLAGPDGAMKVPRWQFEAFVWSSIERISQSLGTHDPWQIFNFLETSAPALGGLTPRVALEQGTSIALVLATAKGEAH